MALFGRKKDDLETEVTGYAKKAFERGGVSVTVLHGDAPEDTELLAGDGGRYYLYNLFNNCRTQPRREWRTLAESHVGSILRANALDPERLTAAQLTIQVRTRVFGDFDDGRVDLSYSRPLAPGLMVALSVDFPETVMTIGAKTISALPLSIDELFEAGQRNTNAEPIDETSEFDDGIHLIVGGSLFIASKVADMQHLVDTIIGPAPNGVVFAIPHREMILYTVPSVVASAGAITALGRLTDHISHSGEYALPGGPLSDALYWWNNGIIEHIGGRTPGTEGLFIDATGAFGDMMNSLAE